MEISEERDIIMEKLKALQQSFNEESKKIRERRQNHPSPTERLEIRIINNKISRQLNLITLR